MSKIIISNNQSANCKLTEKVRNAGFSQNKSIHCNGLFLTTFFKKKSIIENFREYSSGFIAVAGTVLYDGHVGEMALDGIYNDFKGDIDSIRKRIIGNYVIAIEKNNKLTIFVDKYSTYNFYYCNNENGFLLCNNIEFFPAIGECQLNEYSLFQEAFECGEIGNETLFRNVRRLLGYECIVFDKDYNSYDIVPIPFKNNIPKYDSINEACEIISKKLRNVYNEIQRAFGDRIAINMTGGLDSRTVLASCLSSGIKPILVHADSNSVSVAGTEEGDTNCVKNLSTRFDLTFRRLNWDCEFPDDFSKWKQLFYKYGLDFTFYGGNSNFHRSYNEWEGDYPAYFDTGLGGEQFRIREAYNDKDEGFKSVSEFVKQYQILGTNSSYIGCYDMSDSFRSLEEYMIKKWEQELEHYEFDTHSGINLDDFEGVRYIQHRVGEGQLINYLNQYTCSISVPSIEQVAEFAWGLKREWRANGKAQLKIIGNLSQECLDIPFFSHRVDCIYDKESGTIKANLGTYEKIGAFMRNAGLRNTWVYEILRKAKNRAFKNNWKVIRSGNYQKELNTIFPAIVKIIEVEQKKYKELLHVDKIPDNDSLVHLIYYAMRLFAYNLMMEDYSTEWSS